MFSLTDKNLKAKETSRDFAIYRTVFSVIRKLRVSKTIESEIVSETCYFTREWTKKDLRLINPNSAH